MLDIAQILHTNQRGRVSSKIMSVGAWDSRVLLRLQVVKDSAFGQHGILDYHAEARFVRQRYAVPPKVMCAVSTIDGQ